MSWVDQLWWACLRSARWREWWVLIGISLYACSCQTVGYYSQAVAGQFEMLAKREPVDALLTEPDTPSDLAAKLRLSQRLLAFAEQELLMPSKGVYGSYANLQRPHAVYVLHAAPELSMQPKRWWYPVVGHQEYRGYFHLSAALAEAKRLETKGYETWINGVDAYSTLGHFRDPLLNTFIERSEAEFAELIFHELAHVTHYVPNDTTFNESLAEAVAREGVMRWFEATGRPHERSRYEQRLKRVAGARAAIQRCANDLRNLYGAEGPDSDKRAAKNRRIERLQRELKDSGVRFDEVVQEGSSAGLKMNNARLNSLTAYEEYVPQFQSLLENCGGDFAEFWRRVRVLNSPRQLEGFRPKVPRR